jgi:hypothetical protein
MPEVATKPPEEQTYIPYVPPNNLIDALELDTQVLFFLDQLYQLELEGERHWSLFNSITRIDSLIFQEDFKRINLILENFDEKRVSFETARSILAITFPVRAQLPTRKPLVERVRKEAYGSDDEFKTITDKYLKFIS